MNRYHQILNVDTLETFVTMPIAVQPENTILLDETNSNFRKSKFDQYPGPTVVVEGMTEQELYEEKAAQATEIDLEYTKQINDVQMKHIGKKAFDDTYVIPQIVINQVNALRAECNQKIFDQTGLTDFQYRQSNPKLATEDLQLKTSKQL